MSALQTAHTSPPKPKQHVKFKLPPALQTFTCFSRLPIELQDAIWEATVDEPGVHWLKLEHPSWDFWGLHGLFASHMVAQINNDAVDTDDEEIDPIKRECQLEPRPSLTKAILTHPENQRADKSWHLYVQKQMATMFATNSLAQRSAMRMMKNADIKRFTLTKDGVRRFTMLNASCDLAFLEYLPPHLYQSDCGLSVRFETEHLSTIRNVAVRYHPDWHAENDTAKCCPRCGRYHRMTRAITPKHLYHFLARSFPNLETVWLVDYMMVARKKEVKAVEKCRGGRHVGPRRSKHAAVCKPQQGDADAKITAQRAKLQSYRATDRTFYEAMPESWLVKDRVLRIKDWLQDSYVRYSKMSKYACHKAPETVKFGILGCKYHDPELAPGDSLGKVARKAKRQADRDPVVTRKSRRKLSLSSDQGIFTFYFDRPFAGDQPHTLPIHYFGSGTLTGFDFEFEMGNLSLDDQHRASVGVLGKDRHLA